MATEAPTLDGSKKPSRSALSAPGFLQLWLSGVCWHWARWGIAFLAAYQVNQVTDSPRLVQLTGTTMWAPLLFGGAIGGVIADRFDRARTVKVQLAVLVPMVALMGWLELSGRLEVWMMYPFLFFAGVGWVGDMTSRRSLVFDIVGQERIDNAMALETVALASGVAAGNLLGGAIADALGVGEALLVVAGLLSVGLVLMSTVPSAVLAVASDARGALPSGSDRPGAIAELREGLRLVRTNRGLRSILGITILANFFFFAYFPAVQRIGARLDASPSQIGLLASMTGFGMMAGSLTMAWRQPYRRGRAYVGGVILGMVMLIPFAAANSLWLASASLFVASFGAGLFGSTQSTLVLTVASERMRGRAMGLLSMAIGALPIGTLVLGEIAEVVDTSAAVITMALLGLGGMTTWLVTHGEVLNMNSVPPEGGSA
jgi:predicted MFS family arabinose efflux permease